MLPIVWNKKKIKAPLSSPPHSELLGLRIITKRIIPTPNSNVVIKPILLLPQFPNSAANPNSCCSFLNSCHLCHKSLPLDKEVYMYGGDLGFCSVACRERQIYLDEMKEIEVSTQRILKSFRRRDGGGGRCETGSLVDEFRHRSRGVSSEKSRVVFL